MLISRYFIAKFLLIIFAISGIGVFAAQNKTISRALNLARPSVRVEITGSVKREDKTISLEKTESVKAGEILDWNVNSINEGNGDAQNYRVVGQIPKGTVFLVGSAKGEELSKTTYSIDGGKTFSAQPLIDEKQPDGTVKKVPAPVSLYTQIRFEWEKPLISQSNLNASYRVQVK